MCPKSLFNSSLMAGRNSGPAQRVSTQVRSVMHISARTLIQAFSWSSSVGAVSFGSLKNLNSFCEMRVSDSLFVLKSFWRSGGRSRFGLKQLV